jgi:hypothetical protein
MRNIIRSINADALSTSNASNVDAINFRSVNPGDYDRNINNICNDDDSNNHNHDDSNIISNTEDWTMNDSNINGITNYNYDDDSNININTDDYFFNINNINNNSSSDNNGASNHILMTSHIRSAFATINRNVTRGSNQFAFNPENPLSTNKGGPVLLHENYQFALSSAKKNGEYIRLYWYCMQPSIFMDSKGKSVLCGKRAGGGRASSTRRDLDGVDTDIKLSGSHTCRRLTEDNLCTLQIRQQIRDIAVRNPNADVRLVYAEVVNSIKDLQRSDEGNQQVPTYIEQTIPPARVLKNIVKYHFAKAFPPNPKSITYDSIHESISLTPDQRYSVQYGKHNYRFFLAERSISHTRRGNIIIQYYS